jgi:hypothetical protein
MPARSCAAVGIAGGRVVMMTAGGIGSGAVSAGGYSVWRYPGIPELEYVNRITGILKPEFGFAIWISRI